jgi:hypothetical protein
MEDEQHTIGLQDLLSQVDRDLDDFRRKHQSDYSTKNISLWWELERERILTRHVPSTLVKKLRQAEGLKRSLAFFAAGGITILLGEIALRLIP